MIIGCNSVIEYYMLVIGFIFGKVKITKQIMTDSARLISPIYEEKREYDKLTTPI